MTVRPGSRRDDSFPIQQRVAVVTGGGSGIGAAIARRLASSGAAVGLVGRRPDRLSGVAQEIRAGGGHALEIVADLAIASAPGKVVETVTRAWGRLDVLVNNAATIRNYRLQEVTTELIDLHLATNVRAPMLLLREALTWLRQSGSGAVVNVSSSSATLSIPGQSMYGMSKAAIEYLTRSYAAELAPYRIRVNCVAPGPVDTEIHLNWARTMDDARAALLDAAPLGRIAQPDEIAWWVEALARPDERFVTGVVVPVDGGQVLNGWRSSIGDAAARAHEQSAGRE
jgi:NAD(P)-dependent dehydrogenase (short-subunit alcohol dehydrogenase family)